MLHINIKDLDEDEINTLGSLAVMFNCKNIQDTLAHCVSFCYQFGKELGEDVKLITDAVNK